MTTQSETMLEIMEQDPITLPPYLTQKGATLIILALLMLAGGVVCMAINQNSFATFLILIATITILAITTLYAKTLLTWQVVSGLSPHIFKIPNTHCYVKGTCQIQIALKNPLPWKFHFLALAPHTSKHLKNHDTHHITLPNKNFFQKKSHSIFCFQISFIAPGPATIWGLRITGQDVTDLFRFEVHIELHDIKLDILPANAKNPLIKPLNIHNNIPREETSELNHIRHYVHGDNIRNIYWKGFAKTNTLLTKVKTHTTEPHIAMVLDSTSPMRSPSNDDPTHTILDRACSSILAQTQIQTLASLWIVPPHTKPYSLCKRKQTQQIRKQLENWYLEHANFSWPHPRYLQETWRNVATALWKDLSTYKKLDFRLTIPKGYILDTATMAQWNRIRMAKKSLQNNNLELTKFICTADDATIMAERMRSRRLTVPFIPPTHHESNLTSTAISNIITTPTDIRPTHIIWITTLPISAQTLKTLQQCIKSDIHVSLAIPSDAIEKLKKISHQNKIYLNNIRIIPY
jgi:hypothetical protein